MVLQARHTDKFKQYRQFGGHKRQGIVLFIFVELDR